MLAAHSTANQKILIVGPAWVGDMVMAQSLFKLLKQQQPTVVIDVLAPAWSLPLLNAMPEVNQAIVLPLGHGQLGLKTRYQIGRQLRQQHYTQAIVLPNSFKSALIPWFARIPKRTGWRGEMRWGLLNDLRYLDKAKLPLMIERFMALGLPADASIPKPYLTPQLIISQTNINAAIKTFQLDLTKPILALCPGAEFGPAKRWPARHYATVANEKLAAGWQVWLFGSAKDQVVAAEIQQACAQKCVDLTGKTQLGEAISLLSLAQQVVSNDSGLMHIASALQRSLVVVYGSSSPRFTPPLAKQVKILSLQLSCSPCFKRECPLQHLNCLNQLAPELVLTAMTELQRP